MITLEEIKKIFELKPDIYQFLNSPLFFLIVVIAVVVFFLTLLVIRRRRNRPKKTIRIGKKDAEPVEECTDYEEPVAPEPKVDEKEMVILELGECVILERDKKSVTVLFNADGTPQINKLEISSGGLKELQDRDLTTRRRKPEYIPCHYAPTTEGKTISKTQEQDIGDVEREVDELLGKKKPNFLNRMTISRGERFMKNKKKDEKETTVEQITETTDVKRQLTEKEVFEENDDEKGLTQDQAIETGILKKETAKEQQDEDMQPTQPDGESKRQIVMKLLEQGKTKDEILKITGYAELTVIKYVNYWTDSQLNVARQLFADGRWGLVKKIVEILDKKETFLVEDGKLYYPGRDKLTYVFLATTIILVCIVVAEIFIL